MSYKQVKTIFASATILLSAGVLSGCAIGGNAIEENFSSAAVSVADSTPTIAPDPFVKPDGTQDASQTDRILDEDTIRLAVTTADLNNMPATALAWANESTGSSGTISEIAQRTESGQTCRSFKALRNAYDGATLYEGDVCLEKGTGWWTRLMRPFGQNG